MLKQRHRIYCHVRNTSLILDKCEYEMTGIFQCVLTKQTVTARIGTPSIALEFEFRPEVSRLSAYHHSKGYDGRKLEKNIN
jgi:hypothetical protein